MGQPVHGGRSAAQSVQIRSVLDLARRHIEHADDAGDLGYYAATGRRTNAIRAEITGSVRASACGIEAYGPAGRGASVGVRESSFPNLNSDTP
jgi:hypothetical protein